MAITQTRKVAIALTIAALALTGCSKGSTNGNAAPDQSSSLTETKAPSATIAFGGDQTLKTGVVITVTDPVSFTPGQFASNYVKTQVANKFDVTIKNGGTTDVDMTTVTILSKSGSNNCVDVLDGDNGIIGAPTDPLAAGATATFSYGIACDAKVGDPLNISISVGADVINVDGKLN